MTSRAEFERLRRERALLAKRALQLLKQRNAARSMLEDILDGVCYTDRDIVRAVIAAGGTTRNQELLAS